MTFKDTLLSLFIILIWGFNFVVIAWGLEGIPPLLMGGLRFLLVASVGCWFVARPKVPLRWILAYGATLSLGQFVFLFSAMSAGMPAGIASLVLQAQALFTLILGGLVLRESIKPYQILAIVIAGGGLVLVGLSSADKTMTGIGFALTLVAAICWAMGNVVNRFISEKGYGGGVSLVIWSAWVPPLPFFLLSYIFEGSEQISASLENFSWLSAGALVYLALIATVLGYGMWASLLSRYPAGQVAPLTLGVPVVGIASATWLLDEQLTGLQLSGIVLVMVGLLFNLRGERLLHRVFGR